MAKVAPVGETVDNPLLKQESGMTLHGEGITTVSFFSGNSQSAAFFLKDRLAQVVTANPWLAGNLVRDASTTKQHGKLVVLRYPKNAQSVDLLFEVNDALNISEDIEFQQLGKIVAKSSAYIKAGTKLLNKDLPVVKLTVAPRAGGEGFAVIFSMSHTVGNGGTYFTLLNMLSADGDIVALDPLRREDLVDKGPDLIGKKAFASHMAPTTILNAVGALFRMLCCRRKPKLHCYEVDKDKVQAQIAEAKAEGLKISMNDILTSGYGQLHKPRLMTMALDYRGKIEGLTAAHAGNYHNGAVYDPKGYATPAAIRESLTSPPPVSRAAMPCCCTAMCCKRATISNWASMTKGDFKIPECQLVLMLPYVDASMVPINVSIVFKSGPGKTAMMLFAKGVSVSQIQSALPLGDPVSKAMFPG